MKYEELKAYKTAGGWKAVYMGKSCENRLQFSHYTGGEIFTRPHSLNGNYLYGEVRPEYNIISEWTEPRTWAVWVEVCEDGIVGASWSKPRRDLKTLATKKITITEGTFDE